MTLQREKGSETRLPDDSPTGETRRGFGWVSAILGFVSMFLGLFINFAGEDQYVGLGGDLSWRVGDIATGWIYGFLIGGALLLAIAVALITGGRSRR